VNDNEGFVTVACANITQALSKLKAAKISFFMINV
jgi:hypothetical protein